MDFINLFWAEVKPSSCTKSDAMEEKPLTEVSCCMDNERVVEGGGGDVCGDYGTVGREINLPGWGNIHPICWPISKRRASLRFEKRLNVSINPQKLSIFFRVFSNRSEALITAQYFSNIITWIKMREAIRGGSTTSHLTLVCWNSW